VGVLYAPYYTTYQFWTSQDARLSLDGQIISPGEPIQLALGNHTLSVEPAGAALEWSIKHIRDREPIPDWVLYHPPVSANGLYATFYSNRYWAGRPALERIDPILDAYYHFLPMARPYTVVWKGWLAVPESGLYGIGLRTVTSAELWIDSVSILEADMVPNEPMIANLELTAGLHPIEIRFLDATDYSCLHLLWSIDGGKYVPVPNEALIPFFSPPQQAYAGSAYR
jgi:hypothetical protein